MNKNEVKKSPKANLEKQRSTYILMGMVLGMSILLFAFEWSTETRKLDKKILISDAIVEELIEITRPEPTPPPPPPQPELEPPKFIEVVDEEVNTKMVIQVEDDQNQRQNEIFVLPPPPKQEEPVISDEIFILVEEQPDFPGGRTAMMKFLSDNIRYPVIAQENNIQGRVTCSFVVERDGSITDVQVLRGVDPSLDREAVRVIQEMPKWKPGKQRNTAVRVRFTLPVIFKLQN